MKPMIILVGSAIGSIPTLFGYELHEWGTFTTVSGSDGVRLTGLQREEEALPAYVRHHPGFANHQPSFVTPPTSAGGTLGKRLPVPAKHVTVKMETPVIYFHSEKAFQAEVRVGFQGGTISQWFPERSGGEFFRQLPQNPAAGPRVLDFSKPYTGSIEWQIEVLSPEQSRDRILFKPGDLLQWTRARIPEANTLRDPHGGTEGFLFYRGMGHFEPGLTTRIDDDDGLELENRTGGEIAYLLVHERTRDGTHRWTEHHSLKDGDTIRFAPADLDQGSSGSFDEALYRHLSENLANQGLLRSEARAMVETWWHSYFATPGLRVFWVLPRPRTDAILPLEVDPAPARTVRVLVGRSEIIRPQQEQAWLALATSADPEDQLTWKQLVSSHRFGLAYQKRVDTLQAQAGTR